ncbi:TcpE family conjugal transfer membrane protein [Streptosporangium sp. NPDC001559]|uniref:TcpE family conjugal transfer membrane protein n=1 Tax=Streptosporangium sp. NPDC001559 TaxID=3366187 RepID=UPI0036F05F64
MDLPTYTNIWRIEKRLYKLYDLRLPTPLPIVWIGVFVGVAAPWSLLLALLGLPFDAPWHVVYLVPPGVVTWLSTRPVIESKRLTELLQSQVRYMGEPRSWCRMAPTSESDEIALTGRVWRADPSPTRVKGRVKGKAKGATAPAVAPSAPAREVRPAVAAAAAAATTAPAVRERPVKGSSPVPRRGTAPALGTETPSPVERVFAPSARPLPEQAPVRKAEAAPAAPVARVQPVAQAQPSTASESTRTPAPASLAETATRQAAAPRNPTPTAQNPTAQDPAAQGPEIAVSQAPAPGPQAVPTVAEPAASEPVAPTASAVAASTPADSVPVNPASEESAPEESALAAQEAPIGPEALRRLRRLAAATEAERAAFRADPPAIEQPTTVTRNDRPERQAVLPGPSERATPVEAVTAPAPEAPKAHEKPAAEAQVQKAVAPGTPVPETAVPRTPAPGTPASETVAPGTPAPGTVIPETAAPAAQAAQTAVPETVTSATVAPGVPVAGAPAPGVPDQEPVKRPGAAPYRNVPPVGAPAGADEGVRAQHRKGQPVPAEQFAERRRLAEEQRAAQAGRGQDRLVARAPRAEQIPQVRRSQDQQATGEHPVQRPPQRPAQRQGPPQGVSIRAVPSGPTAGPAPVVPPVPVSRPGQAEPKVRRVESVVGRDSAGGWRRLAQVVIGPGAGRTDGSEIDEARAKAMFTGSRRVVVLGCTGGAGQTTTALMLGHTLARHREDRVLAVDANTGANALSGRIQAESPETLTSLLAGLDGVNGYLGMRAYTSRCASGLEVLAGDADSGAEQRLSDRTLFSDRRLGRTMDLLDRHYKLVVVDPAAALAARVLPYADQLVLVVPASEDGPDAVAMTYEWLDGHGCADLRKRAIMVVNGVSRRSMGDVEQAEAVARGRCRAIVRVPWEDELAPGRSERVEPSHLRAPGRRAYLALAGVVVAGFGTAQAVRPSEEEVAQ